MLLFLKVKKKKDLERDDINDVEQNELEVDEVVEQELAFQALSGPKDAFRIFVNERVASQPQLAVFDIETFEIRSEGSFRVYTLKCATCWKRLQVAQKSSDNTQLSFYSSTLTSHSCAAKLLKRSKEEEADDRSQQWSTQFKSSHLLP
jgi:hypothetical protein